MAIMWNGSLIPWLDPNGTPYSGAKAFFFDAGTTTPRTVYQDSGLGISHDHPVVANASGMFPAIFLTPGDYRLRISDADDVTVWDVDGISTPTVGDSGGGGGGDTPDERLNQTADYKFRHGTGAHAGWVRANGRTIGSGASGATERANADCENLFLYLWGADPTLVVSGGRGGNAASDWAAAKTIALPDIRLRGLIGMASMGGTVSDLIAAGAFDNAENGDTLGATVGAGAVVLTVAQLAAHEHTGIALTAGLHEHGYTGSTGNTVRDSGSSQNVPDPVVGRTTSSAGAHTHVLDIDPAGSSAAHPNVQPSAVATCYLKL